MNEDEWIAEFRAALVRHGIPSDDAKKLVTRADYAKMSEGFIDRPADAAEKILRESDQILRLLETHPYARIDRRNQLIIRIFRGALSGVAYLGVPLLAVYALAKYLGLNSPLSESTTLLWILLIAALAAPLSRAGVSDGKARVTHASSSLILMIVPNLRLKRNERQRS